MARWLVSLAVALLLALALHGIALWGIAQQMQAMGSVLAPHADPMFTRQITQATVVAAPLPSVLMQKQAAAQQSIAEAATKSIVKNTLKNTPLPDAVMHSL